MHVFIGLFQPFDTLCISMHSPTFPIRLVLATILLLLELNLSHCESLLPPCSIEKITQDPYLCKLNNEHCSACPPKPWPAKITPIVNIKDILDLDKDKKSLTVFTEINLIWDDPAISVKTPNNSE